MGLEISALHVRRSTYINATRERVWEEFTTPERLKVWLSRGHTLHSADLKLGGHLRFSVDLDGQEEAFGGEILVLDPAKELSFTSQWDNPTLAFSVPTLWTVRLRALYAGTLVEIFHHGFEQLGAEAGDALEGYESGWNNIHLKALRELCV